MLLLMLFRSFVFVSLSPSTETNRQTDRYMHGAWCMEIYVIALSELIAFLIIPLVVLSNNEWDLIIPLCGQTLANKSVELHSIC